MELHFELEKLRAGGIDSGVELSYFFLTFGGRHNRNRVFRFGSGGHAFLE
jgi:hypothetical protein